jgi:hypothetical protein
MIPKRAGCRDTKLYFPGKPAKKKLTKIYGYDVETGSLKEKNDNQKYISGALSISDDDKHWFKSRGDFMSHILKNYKIYRGCMIGCHNLGFDFNATFRGYEVGEWHLFRSKSGGLLYAYSYIEKGKFTKYPKEQKKYKISFIDTANFAQMTLAKMAKIIGLKKMDWDFSKDDIDADWHRFLEYNMNDAVIARKFLEFLEDGFFRIGTNIKMTLASTSEKIFRNVYLDRIYRQQPLIEMEHVYKGYYGGRTEVLWRGLCKEDLYYYDVNSIYPAMMFMNDFPDPTSSRMINKAEMFHIMNFEGICECDIDIPEMGFQPLPFHTEDGKTKFMAGIIHGYWTHVEIRKAISLGCKIISLGKSVYYGKTCRPFEKFVTDLYALRMRYKLENNPMEYVIKIILNSLYGKFAQKFLDRELYIHNSDEHLGDFMEQYEFHEHGDYFVFNITDKPRCFCFPIWSAYVTSYARIYLMDLLYKASETGMVVAYDTDSIIASAKMDIGKGLGELKLEHVCKKVIFVRPKMYAFMHDDPLKEGEKPYCVRCRGLNKPVSYDEFEALVKTEFRVIVKKFTKFKESLKGIRPINAIYDMEKMFSLDDDKRRWPGKFSIDRFESSKPLRMIDGHEEDLITEDMLIKHEKRRKNV